MYYRSIFVSDFHLGTRDSKAEELLTFLKENDCETLVIVGDAVDGWSLKRNLYFPQAHIDVIQKLLRKARKGTKVVYITGNHDEFIDHFFGEYGNITICQDYIHITSTNKKLLIIHGDELDIITQNWGWLAHLGSIGYEILLRLNTILHFVREYFGLGRWSLSARVKGNIKDVVGFVSNFEQEIVHYANRVGVEGVICGHIHTAAIRNIDGIEYYNTGDWVESCTALVENDKGEIELIKL
jgi:UDP-2,3-diacylglucosamine pyrophosphatase LpxH